MTTLESILYVCRLQVVWLILDQLPSSKQVKQLRVYEIALEDAHVQVLKMLSDLAPRKINMKVGN